MCEKHPNYKRRFKPVANCLECWKEWASSLQEKNKKLEQENKIYSDKLRRFSSALREISSW